MTRRSWAIKDDQYWDVRLSWTSAIFFIVSTANASIKNVLPIPTGLSVVLSFIAGCIIIGTYANSWRELQRRNGELFWRTVVIFVFIYLLSAILIVWQGDPLDLMIKGTAFLTFAWWIPTGVFACSVSDKDLLYKIWVKASYIISFFCLLIFFFRRPDENNTGGADYNIFFGYNIILPLLIQINEYLKRKRIVLLLLILVELVSVVLFASRGILLSLFFFILYKSAFGTKNPIGRGLALIVFILLAIIFTSSIQAVAENAIAFLDMFNIQSRTLEALATGMIDDTSGRDAIWKVCFKMIDERPLLGWGLGGEYYRIAKEVAGTLGDELTADAMHPHNGIIQNFVCFGWIIGAVVNLILLLPLFYINRHKNISVQNLILIFASSSVIPICVSSANFFTTPSVAVYLFLSYFSKKPKNINTDVIK